MKNAIVLGISSGIAEFKALDLIRGLRKEGIEIHVIMTKNSALMLNPKEFEKASGNRVSIDLFEKGFDYKKILEQRKVGHIEIADKANLFVVIPATANIIGKIANGIADDFLTTSLMATKAPIVICPAMNVNMWSNPIVQNNISRLKQLGYIFLDPEHGMLACGYEGPGRLMDIGKVKDELMKLLRKKDELKGKKVIVTAGATIEDIDPVRIITNKSSGKMGIAMAEECFLRGADVLLLRGKNSVRPRYPVKEIVFSSVSDLMEKIRNSVKNTDIILHAAAVSDFTIEKKRGKIKSNRPLHLELAPSAKILEHIKEWNKTLFLVGFKAEYKLKEEELIDSAFNLLKSSDADIMVANDVGREKAGFDTDTNEVIIISKNRQAKKLPLSSKALIARGIMDEVARRLR